MSITIRALRLPEDGPSLDRLDAGFITSAVYDVTATSRGFSLVERSLQAPLQKRYLLESRDMTDANVAVVAETAGAVVGAASLRFELWNRRAVVEHLYVDRPARGQGVGGRLLRALRSRAIELGARSLFVETQNVNVPAVRFYERNGFTLVGLDIAMYDPEKFPGEIALFFEHRLDSETIKSAP